MVSPNPSEGGARTASWAGAALAATGFAATVSIFDRSVIPMDEGHLCATADWMLGGKLLYRDIHTGIFPGIYYLTAGLLSLFGRDVLVTRVAQIALNASMVLLLWRLAVRAVPRPWEWLPPILYLGLVVVAFPVLTMFNYSPLALCYGLAALWTTLRYLERGHVADAIATGVLLAASALTKQNFGGLVFVAIWLTFFWQRGRSALADRSLIASCAPIVVAGAGVTLISLVHFAWSGNLGDLIESTLVALGGSQLASFGNPIPPVIGPHPVGDIRFTFLYSPPALFNYLVRGETVVGQPVASLLGAAIRSSYGIALALLAAAPVLLWLSRDRGDFTGQRGDFAGQRSERAIAVFAICFFPGIFPSAIWSHLAFVLPPLLLVLALVAARVDGALAERVAWGAWAWRALFVVIALASTAVTLRTAADIRGWYHLPLEIDRVTLKVEPAQRDIFRAATSFIERCAAPGEPIFVAPDMPLLYFATDRPNPSPFDLTIPGNVDGQLIRTRLAETRTRCIVFNPRMYLEFPPFEELFPELTEAFASEYALDTQIRGGTATWHGLVRRAEPGASD